MIFILITFLLSEGLEGRLDDTTSESEDQVKCGLLLDVVPAAAFKTYYLILKRL